MRGRGWFWRRRVPGGQLLLLRRLLLWNFFRCLLLQNRFSGSSFCQYCLEGDLFECYGEFGPCSGCSRRFLHFVKAWPFLNWRTRKCGWSAASSAFLCVLALVLGGYNLIGIDEVKFVGVHYFSPASCEWWGEIGRAHV